MIWPEYELWVRIAYWCLVALAAVLLFVGWRRRWSSAAGMRYPTKHRMEGVKPGWRARLVHLPYGLRVVAVALLLVGLSRPQLAEDETADVEGIDIVVAFDMSGSMQSVDISDADLVKVQNAGKEPKDRFHIAVDVLRDFIKSRKYDRVSLVVFGKEAFLQFPLTLDYGVMLRILDDMQLGDIDGSGTAIGNALAMSLARLRESEAKTRLVILLTDGEDNGSKVAPLEMAKEAAKKEVKVFTILVGTDDQSRQPTGMADAFTRRAIYQKVDNKVNPALLEKIAETTGARFFRATDQEKLEKDFREILDELEKSRLIDYASADRREIYGWFVFPALALLFLEVLLGQTVLRRFP